MFILICVSYPRTLSHENIYGVREEENPNCMMSKNLELIL